MVGPTVIRLGRSRWTVPPDDEHKVRPLMVYHGGSHDANLPFGVNHPREPNNPLVSFRQNTLPPVVPSGPRRSVYLLL